MEKITRLPRTVLLLLLVSLAGESLQLQHSHAQNEESPLHPPDHSVFSLSCRDAGLRDVLGNLAAQKGINLAGLDVIPPTVTVTVNLTAVPIETGLLALVRAERFRA